MFDNWLKECEKNLFDYKTIKSNTEKLLVKLINFGLMLLKICLK